MFSRIVCPPGDKKRPFVKFPDRGYVRIKNKNEKLSSGDTFVFNKIILIGNDGTNNLEI